MDLRLTLTLGWVLWGMFNPMAFLRALLLTPLFALHTLFCSFVAIFLLVLPFPRSAMDGMIRYLWCGPMVWFSGIRAQVSGLENVPKEKGFLYLFLHCSHMDIPTLFVSSPKSFRFGAKASLFKIPIFGYAVTLSGTLPITRENRAKVMEVYRQAEERVAKGEAFALAPEGGRRVTEEIPAFKSGPFIFAINARMPVVPVVICGMDKVLHKKSWLINKDRWTRKVGIKFLPAIDMAQVPIEDMKKVKEQVRTDMVRDYQAMRPLYSE